jgi:endonuclease YncB( thermonuclease family)
MVSGIIEFDFQLKMLHSYKNMIIKKSDFYKGKSGVQKTMARLIGLWLGLVLIGFALTACGSTRPASVEVAVATDAATVAPTATPSPTPMPTETPTPTVTPLPTETPTPTPFPFPPDFDPATVVQVHEGNRIEVDLDGERVEVRYLLTQTEPLDQVTGKDALLRNRELVEGQLLHLERDVSDRDREGRLLRYVYLPDGRRVNEILIRDGYAQVPNAGADTRYESELRMAQADAMLAGKGMWGGQRARTNRNAILRTGPGSEYESVGTLPAGEPVEVIAKTANGAWYQLADGRWIARFQVDNAPLTLPVQE